MLGALTVVAGCGGGGGGGGGASSPLFVLATNPSDGATGVATNSRVDVTFSVPLDPASVHPASAVTLGNFIHGPIIGWDAPQAFVSDMGFFTFPQLILSSALGGSSTDVLCAKVPTSCGPGPLGSTEVPRSVRQQAVKQLEG